MELSSLTQFQDFCAKSRNHIVIDCGHTPISINDKKIVFGKNNIQPSNSEIQTIEFAVEISEHLLSLGKKITLNLCFSDVGYKINPEIRKKIKNILNRENFISLLPSEYRKIIENVLNKVSIDFNFQSMNSNIATAAIKKIKKQNLNSTSKKLFEKYSCYFLLKDNYTFGILSSLMLNHSYGIDETDMSYFNQLLCSQGIFNERELLKFPLLNLKKKGFIGLYDKFDGILCPATYMGNLLNIPNGSDVISIYSRSDDSNIGEKILAGAIAHQHFSNDSKLFYSITKQLSSEDNEIFLLERNFSPYKEELFSEGLSNFLADKKNYRLYL